jgi:hypothetical protein
MRDLKYLGLSDKLGDKDRAERKRSLIESFDWPDNEAHSHLLTLPPHTVKLAFGGGSKFTPSFLTVKGVTKQWSDDKKDYKEP